MDKKKEKEKTAPVTGQPPDGFDRCCSLANRMMREREKQNPDMFHLAAKIKRRVGKRNFESMGEDDDKG